MNIIWQKSLTFTKGWQRLRSIDGKNSPPDDRKLCLHANEQQIEREKGTGNELLVTRVFFKCLACFQMPRMPRTSASHASLARWLAHCASPKCFQQLPRKQIVYTIMVVVLITGGSSYQNCPLSGITAISILFINERVKSALVVFLKATRIMNKLSNSNWLTNVTI